MELVTYRIDRNDTLTQVGDNWDAFAVANGAPHLADHVVGHDLWEFISDATTRQMYAGLLATVRGGRAVTFAYRCDSPSLRRFMRMTMTAGPEQGVAFESLTLRTEPRLRPLPGGTATPAGKTLLTVCSWCKRVCVGDEWLDIDVAIERQGLFIEDSLPSLTHGACPECVERIMAELDVA